MSDRVRHSPLRALSAAGRAGVYRLGVLSAARAASLVGIAFALAQGIASVFDGTQAWREALLLGTVSALARAGLEWAHTVLAARTAMGAKEALRAELSERVTDEPGTAEGAATALATGGLDGLDDYYGTFLPALVSAATVPLVAGAAILFTDWVSGVIVVLTVPLVPVFMALIGMHTRERVAVALDSLERLSDHLVELARGLPVLVGLGRAREQTTALQEIAERQHRTTLATLRTAFLSAFALELIATISVAVVAVFIGVRLVSGDLPLAAGLFALLLAPECFTPLRELGSAFHASEDGLEAMQRARDIVTAPRRRSIVSHGALPLRVRGLSVHHPDRSTAAVLGVSFEAAPGELVLLDGPSGAGKSTVLAALGGRITDSAGAVRVSGSITGVPESGVAWLPQRPRMTAETAHAELVLYGGQGSDEVAREVLSRLGLASAHATHPAVLSPGEQRRLAFGRVLMRIADGAQLVLLDEPTAHLDAASALAITDLIADFSGRSLAVVMASHDDRVRALATRSVILAGGSGPVRPTDEVAANSPMARAVTEATTQDAPVSAWRELLAVLWPVAPRFALASLLGAGAALFAVALTAVSAWLIVRAAEQPPIMYLMVAIVGVRFFGIGRAVLRYEERLVTHDAVFGAVTRLRLRLWSGLAARGISDRASLEGGRALDRLVRDADVVRDLTVRVVQPVAVAIIVSSSVLLTAAIIHPPSVAPLGLALLVSLVVAPAIAVLADRSATRTEQRLRSRVLRRFAALVAAADDLAVNGAAVRARRELTVADAAASREARRGALALGLGAAVATLGLTLTAVWLLPATAGELEPGLVAVLCLVPLGVVDVFLDHVNAIQQAPALRAALRRVASTTSATSQARAGGALDAPIETLELDAVAVAWSSEASPLIEGASARLRRGDWLTITGPSGSGKTTMLMLLLGELEPVAGRYLVNGIDVRGLDAASLRARIAWCPQEGHLFKSTLRGNLIIARGRADAPEDAELEDALRQVGLGPLLERLPAGLETQIGSAGAFLSGGERQRVAIARTLLTHSDVVLIDEPTAHLDEEAAVSLMADLRDALADRITVLVTHHPGGARSSDVRITLGAVAQEPSRQRVGTPA